MVTTFRPSETALKVAQAMVVLSGKPGWKDQLPDRTGELSEKLLLASRTFGYNPTTLRLVKQPKNRSRIISWSRSGRLEMALSII